MFNKADLPVPAIILLLLSCIVCYDGGGPRFCWYYIIVYKTGEGEVKKLYKSA